MIRRRTIKFLWSEALYQVRTDHPWWRRWLTLPFGPCYCLTHPHQECQATWRIHPR